MYQKVVLEGKMTFCYTYYWFRCHYPLITYLNLHHFLASNQKTLLTKLPRLALSLEFSKLGLAISLIQTLTLERGGCSAELRQGLPVLLSPRQKLLQRPAGFVRYPVLILEALPVSFIFNLGIPITHSVQDASQNFF